MAALDISIESYISKIKSLSAAVLWDRSYGAAFIVKDKLIDFTPGNKLAGPAWLVNVENSILPIIQALDAIPEHHILVVNNLSADGDALLGDIIMTAAKKQAVAGILVFGKIRDAASAAAIGLPVWAKGTTVKPAPLGDRVEAFPEEIEIAGGTIRQGDWIVGDRDDLICIDKEKIRFIIKSAEVKNKKENRYMERLNSGNKLADLMHLKEFLQGTGQLVIEF
jgi:4-hydroxy-4-methyl-2-oxoglutarate aldolase